MAIPAAAGKREARRDGGSASANQLNALEDRRLPRIQIWINGSPALALLDTAAGSNFLRESLCPLTFSRYSEDVALAATGKHLRIQGRAALRISFGDAEEEVADFLISRDLAYDCILGSLWLQQQKAVLDMERGCIHLGSTRRRTLHWQAAPCPEATATLDPESLDHGFDGPDREEFGRLVGRFQEIFKKLSATERTSATTHVIRLKDDRPIRTRPYRVSDEKKKVIEEQVQEMLRDGIIEPSSSPYASSVVIVPKKDGKLRFCVDYRRINDATITEPTPMPIIHDTLKDLGGAKVFSSLDLLSGYWQVPMDARSSPVTAFSTPDGSHYQFRVMPFGLKGAPTTFQRMMTQDVLAGFLHKFCMVYIDDIIVYSQNAQEHLQHLTRVFERLQQHRLRLNPKKCVFGRTKLEYLGHLIDEETVLPLPKHLGQLAVLERPKDRKALRSLVGLSNWLRDYIPHFAQMIAPLTDLLSPRKPFKWNNEAEAALSQLRRAFARPLALHRPDPALPFVLQTDASDKGIGAVLYQLGQGGAKRIISYSSAKFTPAEKRYHVNEKECLALIWAIRRYRHLLEGRKFTARTDSKALTWLNNMKDTKTKLLRWSLLLQEFDFDIEHCAGADNELPDLLSRHPRDVPAVVNVDCHRLVPPTMGAVCAIDQPLSERLRRAQEDDENCRSVRAGIAKGDPEITSKWCLTGNLLRRRRKGQRPTAPYAPTTIREDILRAFHDDAGHPGREETYRAVLRRFYWPGVSQDIRRHVARCPVCLTAKVGSTRPAAPLKARRPEHPWRTIAVDLMGPYPKSSKGKTHILVVTDLFSRWVEAFAITNARAGTIARALEDCVFARFGYPKSILSDNSPVFRSRAWSVNCERWECAQRFTPVYHPRANPTERRNQEIKKGLRIRLQGLPHTGWARVLPNVLRDLRGRRNSATGMSPHELLFGYPLRMPGDWSLCDREVRRPQSERVREARKHQLEYVKRYDGGVPSRKWEAGEQVLVRNHPVSNAMQDRHAGFEPKWSGPFVIRQVISDRVYLVDRDGDLVRYHLDDLKAPPSRTSPSLGRGRTVIGE